MNRFQISRVAFFLALMPVVVAAQGDSSNSPYLLQLERRAYQSRVCVLLQNDGAYHLEIENPNSTKVFEGSLDNERLHQLVNNLQDGKLEQLSQKQIDEPLIRTLEPLNLSIFRKDHWQDLVFYSRESQEPYRQSLRPLLRWLAELHKLPHRELSEEQARTNCVIPRTIVLKKRADETPAESARKNMAPLSAAPQGTATSAPHGPEQVQPTLLRVLSFGVRPNAAYQKCALITMDGSFRSEERTQKPGKTVTTEIAGGSITPDELLRLQHLLMDAWLLKMQHHESAHASLRFAGEMMDLQIFRPAGIQHVVLSSTYGDTTMPFFYSGDGNIKSARPLIAFIGQQIEAAKLKSSDPGLRNGCQSAP